MGGLLPLNSSKMSESPRKYCYFEMKMALFDWFTVNLIKLEYSGENIFKMLKTYCLIFFFCFLIEFGTRSVDYDGSLSVFWRRMLSDLIYRRAMPASVSVSFMWFRPRHSPLASRLISTSCDPSVIKGILHLHPLSYILSRELLNEVFGGVGNRMIIETSLDNEANVPRID